MTQERQLLMLKICDFYVLKAGTERNRKSTYIYEKKKTLKIWLAHFSKIAEGEKEREEEHAQSSFLSLVTERLSNLL